MREIKFRVWEKKEQRFAKSGRYVIGLNGELIFKEMDWQMDEKYFLIMQYIDRKDKNGREIYEGDVVSAYGGECHYGDWEFSKIITVDDFIGDTYELGHYEYLEVIGNVHEHPELLEVKQWD